MALYAHLSIAGMLVFGTLTSVILKAVYEFQGVGLDGKSKFFHKPWFMTTVMFVAMAICLPLAMALDFINGKLKSRAAGEKKEKADQEQPPSPVKGVAAPAAAAAVGPIKEPPTFKQILSLAIPALFDLASTILIFVGLLWVTASVFQMLRGAGLFFAALFAVLFLKRRLNKFHYLGIAGSAVGIGVVGLASILSGVGSSQSNVSTAQMLMGMGLIVLAQAVQSAQITYEDFFLSNLHLEPMKVVGYEGIFGTLMMVCVFLPIAHFLPGSEGTGLHENTLDSLHMLGSSRTLLIAVSLTLISFLGLNAAAMMVTSCLGVVTRTILETLRTLFVWLVGLLMFYTPLGMGTLGEPWTRWSFVQGAGFAVLVAGTMVYRKGNQALAAAAEQVAIAAHEAAGGSLPLSTLGLDPSAKAAAGAGAAGAGAADAVVVVPAGAVAAGGGAFLSPFEAQHLQHGHSQQLLAVEASLSRALTMKGTMSLMDGSYNLLEPAGASLRQQYTLGTGTWSGLHGAASSLLGVGRSRGSQTQPTAAVGGAAAGAAGMGGPRASLPHRAATLHLRSSTQQSQALPGAASSGVDIL